MPIAPEAKAKQGAPYFMQLDTKLSDVHVMMWKIGDTSYMMYLNKEFDTLLQKSNAIIAGF